jgi:DNA-binding protein YbaB
MDIMKLMKQAKNIKKMQSDIAKMTVEAEEEGAKLVLTGNGTVKSFEISESLYQKGREHIERAATTAIDTCLKKQMELYKQKAKDAMGGLDLSGFTG